MSCGFGVILLFIIKHNYDAVAELPEDYLIRNASLKAQNEEIMNKSNLISKEETILNQTILDAKENISTSEKLLQAREKIIGSWNQEKLTLR